MVALLAKSASSLLAGLGFPMGSSGKMTRMVPSLEVQTSPGSGMSDEGTASATVPLESDFFFLSFFTIVLSSIYSDLY
jgi:hypothetical protein